MAGAVKRKQQRYSYADYLSWDDYSAQIASAQFAV